MHCSAALRLHATAHMLNSYAVATITSSGSSWSSAAVDLFPVHEFAPSSEMGYMLRPRSSSSAREISAGLVYRRSLFVRVGFMKSVFLKM